MPTETREATVATIKWEREGRAWKRLRMDDGEIWTGEVGDVSPGMLLQVEGEIEVHEKFGKSFAVKRVLNKHLPTVDGLKAWLMYRLPEVGEARADELIERFGDNLGEVMKSDYMALTAVSGITEERAKEISETYISYQDEQRLVAWLTELGLGMGAAIKAYNALGPSLEDTIASDPYELMLVPTITFEVIDPVAKKLGVKHDDPRRVRAMAFEALTQELSSGHCYMDKLPLFVKLTKATGVTVPAVGEAVFSSKHITVREREVLLRRIDAAERSITSNALRMLDRTPLNPPEGVELPDWLDDSQREAALGLMTAHLSVLTGGPGTGKTTTLDAALSAIEAAGARIKLAAPTGKAAKRMTEVTGRHATTIHKLLEWTPEGFKRNGENPIEAEVVVLDETSMMEIELCRDVFDALGDARVILVGDVDQLPPVGPGQPLQDIIASGVVPVYRLDKTHRQAGDSWVIDNAARIIAGVEPALNGGGFAFEKCHESAAIVAAVIELYRKSPEIQVLTPEHNNGAGTVALNTAVQKALNPRDEYDEFVKAGGYQIYEDDRVLYTRNNKENGLVNGDIGVVRRIYSKGDKVFASVEFEGKDGLYELSGSDAAPLTLAYAMTVHKAQGSEWAHVVVVTDKAHWSLARRLFYTAVTRTSDRLTVLGSEEAISRAVKSNRNLSRRTLLKKRLAGDGA